MGSCIGSKNKKSAKNDEVVKYQKRSKVEKPCFSILQNMSRYALSISHIQFSDYKIIARSM